MTITASCSENELMGVQKHSSVPQTAGSIETVFSQHLPVYFLQCFRICWISNINTQNKTKITVSHIIDNLFYPKGVRFQSTV